MNPQYQALLGKKLVADNVAPGPKVLSFFVVRY